MKEANGGNRWIATLQGILAMMYFLKTAAAAKDENDYSKDMRHKDEDETDDSQSAMVWVILAILGGGFLFFLYNTWRCHQKKQRDQEELDEEEDDGNTKIEIQDQRNK